MTSAPQIVVTTSVASDQADPEAARRKHELYAEAIRRHGGEPVLVSTQTPAAERDGALVSMTGLLLSGGTDVDPARYGQPVRGAVEITTDRDALEATAWEVAAARDLPVLGICRGLQVINVLLGGTLLQDVAGHTGPAWPARPAPTHPVRVVPGTRLARVLFPRNVGGGVVEVNSYHHQAVRKSDLAPGLIASAWANSKAGELVEGIETRGGRFVVGVQCHPERQESTAPEFERLFSVFVDACRGAANRR
jgi:putative glutamine amidotransferase